MTGLAKCASKYSGWAPTILRVILAVVFIAHGYGKLWGSAPGLTAWTGMITGMGMPAFMAYVAAGIEFFGGILVLLGFFTRYAALLIAVVMVFAVALVKAKLGLVGGYELDIALFADAAGLVMLGPGKLSLEKAWFKKEY